MRNVLLAVVLVGASFAGGAVANGPGLGWARALVEGRPGPGRIETLPPGEEMAGPQREGDSDTTDAIPSAPVPPLVVGPPSDAEESDPPPPPSRRPKPTAEAPPPARQAARPEPEPGRKPEPEAERPKPFDLKGLGTPLPRAEGPRPSPAPGPEEPLAPPPVAAPVPVDAPTAPAPEPPGPEAGREATTSRDRGWPDLRRRMREMGVARYWVEGEPDGQVRFRCVIPLAGRRAVGQQFEAEGDDALQAADAALRRVALWRATEMP